MLNHIPLFPLNTVLFPGGILPLRIFEPRYLDMVSESMHADSGFGICLITDGNETGMPAECHMIGTLARIVDFQKEDDGLLGITVQGEQRFRIYNKRLRQNGLLEGDIRIIENLDAEEVPVRYQLLSDLLLQIVEKYKLPYQSENEKFLNADWVSCRLAELLPLALDDKQSLLETDDPLLRLEQIQSAIERVTPEQT